MANDFKKILSGGYVTLSNMTAQEGKLSYKARGLLLYMCSLPDGWDFSVERIAEASEQDGEVSVRSGLNELEKYGYLTRTPKRGERRLEGYCYTLYDVPSGVKETLSPQNVETTKCGDHETWSAKKINNIQKPHLRKETEYIDNLTNVRLSCEPSDEFSLHSDEKAEKSRVNYSFFANKWNEICKSLPKVGKLTDSRKRAIKLRLSKFSQDEIITAMEKAEASDFLSGRDGVWDKCSFDWVLNEANLIKILEGNYDNNRKDKAKEEADRKENEELERLYGKVEVW